MMLAPVIAMTLVLFVSLGVGAVDARDCRDETPLPADVKLVPPGPDVSTTAARFAGTWVGAWRENSVDTVCATLVVEELLSTGHTRVIYSHGAWAPLRIPQPRFFRATGRIVDDVLHFVLPLPDRPPLAYKFAPDGSLWPGRSPNTPPIAGSTTHEISSSVRTTVFAICSAE
jgi:hypothetical protein